MRQKSVVMLLIVILLAVVGTSAAQESTPAPCLDCPSLIPPDWNMDGLEIPYQRVSVTIENQVVTTRVEQLFRNPGNRMLEGTYFFPLPPGAAVSELTMWVDDMPIEARILGKDEAREIYDAIVRQLRDPALLEYVGNDAIQANVFPIPPGDERKIEIEYTHLLTAENGALRYVYPQSVGLYTQTPLDEQSIHVEIRSNEAIRTIYSPSHHVAVDRPGEFSAVVGYEDANVLPEDDFELYYTVSPEEIGLTLLSHKNAGEDGFFLLLVAPGIEPGDVVAKDVILVLDTSGSMAGGKMSQAQEAAAYVIEHLNPEDRFALISFSTGVSLYQRELLPATQPGDYRQYIDSLEAVGGTNISTALLEAANLVGERPATIIFLTDGLATEGITNTQLLLEAVGQAMPPNARLFAFGVGDDVDTILLDTLAADHRGATTYVRTGQAVDEAVSGFYAKVGSPVLTDITLDMGGIRTEQVYPTELPDLFAGTQLVVAGRYRQGGPTTITLRGTVNGQEQVFTYPDQTFRDEGGNAFIPRLWATRAIGHLMQQIRLQGEDPELVQSIITLSTRYGIITPYTSFLIEEDDIFAQSGEAVMEQAEEMLAAPREASGAAAVDRAAAEGEMSAAEAPMALPTRTVADESGQMIVQTAVRAAGSRTFFLRGGVWVDSAFDGESEPRVIDFASDAYFDLLSDRPELGEALALGGELVIVIDGEAYRVTSGEAGEPVQPIVPGGASSSGADEAAPPADAPETGRSGTAASSGISQLCASALVVPLLALGGVGVTRRRRKGVR